MLHRLFVHLVWTTRDRRPTITYPVAIVLHEQLAMIARQERALVIETGIVATHVHMLLRLHPATSIPRLVQRLKGTTSYSLRANHQSGTQVRWAKGYSVRSVSEQAIADVHQYVATQSQRHPAEVIPGWPPARS